MEIKRDYYLNKLINRMHNGLVKIITGVRRCGKSYLMNNIFYDYLLSLGIKEDHIIRFAFDSSEDLAKIDDECVEGLIKGEKLDSIKFVKYINNKLVDEDMYYLLLDEIQLLDGFEAVLNSYLRKRNMDVYVSGSNAKFLSKDIITEFAGRGDEIHMSTLSFSEFMSVYEGDKQDGFNEYLVYGGIPMVVLRKDRRDREALLNNLFQEIYIKDIVKRNKIKNVADLEDLLNIISSATGSLTNPEKLKNTFHSKKNSDISSDTIRRYISHLEDAFLIESAHRYDVKGKNYIGTPLKYYFTDLGLRNSRIGFRQIEETHLMENIIFNELKRRGMQVDVGVVTTNENNKRKQLEVDFVCNEGSKRYYIQSAYAIADEEKKKQESASLLNINDSFKKIIIVKDGYSGLYTQNGILILNIFDFLLNPDSIFS